MLDKLFFIIITALLFSGNAFAQTSAFVYQGKLNDGAMAANGTYQFTFKLYDAASGGGQVGATIEDLPATVTNGIFSVNLDFGANSFDGAARYIEISVRANGSQQPYTALNPRQPIASTPYAMRSLNATNAVNATNLGNIPAALYTQTSDARLSDSRDPRSGSSNYIQNTQNQQVGATNFNISGEGKAGIITANTQFNLNGNRFLSGGNGNLFVGFETGAANGAGGANSFVGSFAGQKNTTGTFNSFFGVNAGQNNLGGNRNSFFGVNAGLANAGGTENSFFGIESGFNNAAGGSNAFFGAYTGKAANASFNSFFGANAGAATTSGGDNAFFGQAAGFKNNTGAQNTAVGSGAGLNNTGGSRNVFAGYLAGSSNTTENDNTFLGYKANGAAGITNATAIGANAVVTQSNTMVLGTNAVTVQVPGTLSILGTFSANALDAGTVYKIGGNRVFHLTGTDNTAVGFESGSSLTSGNTNAFFGSYTGKANTTGFNNTFVGAYAGRENLGGTNNSFFGANAGISNTSGTGNAFYGSGAGFNNFTGANNAFFGSGAGLNSNGQKNAFFGNAAGAKVSSGSNNVFIGASADVIGSGANSNNVAIGYNARIDTGVNNSIAIGANSVVSQDNRIQLGTFNTTVNIDGTLSSDNINVGNKIFTNYFKVGNDIMNVGLSNSSVPETHVNSILYAQDIVSSGKITATGDIGTNSKITAGDGTFNGVVKANQIRFPSLATGGSNEVCTFFSFGPTPSADYLQLSSCSSSIRYKNNVQNFTRGLELVRQLRPVTFDWKSDGSHDVGFIAEEVNQVEPILTRYNDKGEVDGVKYSHLTTALVNAVKEQQTQIEAQTADNQKMQDQIKQQQKQIDELKSLVCAINQTSAICRTEKKEETKGAENK